MSLISLVVIPLFHIMLMNIPDQQLLTPIMDGTMSTLPHKKTTKIVIQKTLREKRNNEY